MVKVRKWNYSNYSSGNYGAHTLAIEVGSLTLYFSYDTVVAFSTPETGLVISQNEWSTTTGKHLNWINGDKSIRIPHSDFEQKLQAVLQKHGLVVA